MLLTLHHTPPLPFPGPTPRNYHLHFCGSRWSPYHCEKRDDDNQPGRTLRASTLPCPVVILFSMVFVGDREAVVRTQPSAHETDRCPTPTPDHTVVQQTLAQKGGTSTRMFLLRMSNRIAPRQPRHDPSSGRNCCRAPHAKAMRPAAMYPVSPLPLLLQVRASETTDTNQGVASARSQNEPSSLRWLRSSRSEG